MSLAARTYRYWSASLTLRFRLDEAGARQPAMQYFAMADMQALLQRGDRLGEAARNNIASMTTGEAA